MSGPPPKPTHLKLVTGNPGKRALPKAEPKPEKGIPSVPAHLSDEAKVEWGRVANSLNNLGVLTMIDRAVLAAYCQAYADWVEAEEQLRRYGKVVKSPIKTTKRTKQGTGDRVEETSGGFPMQSPFLPIRNRALELMHKFAVEFGMTPASRSRIVVTDGAQTEDPAAQFFSS